MNKFKNRGWLLFDTIDPCVPVIVFDHDSVDVTIQWDGVAITNIILMDLAPDNPMYYQIHRKDDGSYEGWFCNAKRDTGYISGWRGDHQNFVWLDRFHRDAMRALLRRVISNRSAPLPELFRTIWSSTVRVVEELDLINPGSYRYGKDAPKWIGKAKDLKPARTADITVHLLRTINSDEVETVLWAHGADAVFNLGNRKIEAYRVPIVNIPKAIDVLKGMYDRFEAII
jgi:hypothetical protein